MQLISNKTLILVRKLGKLQTRLRKQREVPLPPDLLEMVDTRKISSPISSSKDCKVIKA